EPEAAALEAVQKQAARRLGDIFRDAVSLQPSGRTGAGGVYRRADLRAAYGKAIGAEACPAPHPASPPPDVRRGLSCVHTRGQAPRFLSPLSPLGVPPGPAPKGKAGLGE